VGFSVFALVRKTPLIALRAGKPLTYEGFVSAAKPQKI